MTSTPTPLHVYVSKVVSPDAIKSTAYEQRGIKRYNAAPISSTTVTGFPTTRVPTYQQYASHIDSFIAATASGKTLDMGKRLQ
jgi:hypothetical protein